MPVFKGCFNPLIGKRNVPNPFFGIDGFGDIKYESHPDMALLQQEHAVNALYRIAKEVFCLKFLLKQAILEVI